MSKRKQGIIPGIAKHPLQFAAWFTLVFVGSIAFLSYADMLPEPTSTYVSHDEEMMEEVEEDTEEEVVTSAPEAPVRIYSEAAGVDARVLNPQSTSINVLDTALTSGAVRYPTSQMLGVEGTVLIFGHSSHLPVVHNKAYQAFNDIETLEEGDIVSVYSATAEYRYSVASVELADASEDVIALPTEGKHLILVTCDTFSKKTSRFVVKADFVGTYALES